LETIPIPDVLDGGPERALWGSMASGGTSVETIHLTIYNGRW
jgi:hypothetical protein